MSVNPPTHHIHTLNEDILLHIFTLNADMFSDPDADALLTTCITSQVCQNWRNLMLAAPLLWAKVIDMDRVFNSGNYEWCDELIRRSGTVPLHLKLDWLKPSENVFRVIRENWHRIQKLVVFESIPRVEVTRLAFGCPAPCLETFEMKFAYTVLVEGDKNPLAEPLFGGDAPMLRNFNLYNHAIDHQTPWLRHLHSLVLDCAYSVRDALAVLAETHSLQELKVYPKTNGYIPSSLPIASLPNLKSLECTGQPDLCTTLLDNLEIPRCSSLQIYISESSDALDVADTEELTSIVNTFTRYAKHFLKSNILPIVHLNYTPGRYFCFGAEATFPAKCFCNIHIYYHFYSTPRQLDHIPSKLALLDLSRTTTLQFRADEASTLGPSFASFFGRLPSLETISIDSISLRHLMTLQHVINTTEKPCVLFPSLKTIDLTIERFCGDGVRVALEFILSRIQQGHAIAVLEMESKLPFHPQRDFDALADIKGLEVMYKHSPEMH